MAETLSTNSGAVKAVGVLTGADFGSFWQPDEAFCDILRDKGVVNQMVGDIARKSTAQGCITDTPPVKRLRPENSARRICIIDPIIPKG
ncbi:MAG: hypothetical protein COB36_12665 [Alphaproteobacteria bacterium]|nr:MAG: hypothetical protein COB36_12665 [Alphaproteobacteria bacterium]